MSSTYIVVPISTVQTLLKTCRHYGITLSKDSIRERCHCCHSVMPVNIKDLPLLFKSCYKLKLLCSYLQTLKWNELWNQHAWQITFSTFFVVCKCQGPPKKTSLSFKQFKFFTFTDIVVTHETNISSETDNPWSVILIIQVWVQSVKSSLSYKQLKFYLTFTAKTAESMGPTNCVRHLGKTLTVNNSARI